MEGEEVGKMVLVNAKQKELGVALMMGVLRGLAEAEERVDQVERLVETEVNQLLISSSVHAFMLALLSHACTSSY